MSSFTAARAKCPECNKGAVEIETEVRTDAPGAAQQPAAKADASKADESKPQASPPIVEAPRASKSPEPAKAPVVEAQATGQQLPDDALEVKVIGKEGDRAVMMVRNRTPFLVLVYVRGVRMGWLRAYRTGIIRGLPVGYHRVYAHSRWGSTHWGPRAMWIPSRWTLFR